MEVRVEAGRETRVDLQLSSKTIELAELLVQADRSYSTASSRAVRDFDLRIRPNRSAQDILQLAPGLVIALFGKFHTHLSEAAKLSFDISGFSSASTGSALAGLARE